MRYIGSDYLIQSVTYVHDSVHAEYIPAQLWDKESRVILWQLRDCGVNSAETIKHYTTHMCIVIIYIQ